MANRHFAKFGDVWKHLPLVEILAIERPNRYWETHAGSAAYEMVDDAERRYGVGRFSDVAPGFAALASSRYLHHVTLLDDSPQNLARYPGSALLAMLELRASCSYLFCDIDPDSVADLHRASARLGLRAHVDVRERDGMTELHQALPSVRSGDNLIVHVDPYDPWARGPSGLCALDFAAALINAGHGLVYWYGYDRPADRAWAYDELLRRRPAGFLWSSDMMVTSDTAVSLGGHFGTATTPGTGCGIVCANVSQQAVDATQRLGQELATAYRGTSLPEGIRGHLEFTFRTIGSPL